MGTTAEPDAEMGPVADEHDMLDDMDTGGVQDMYNQQVEQFDASVRYVGSYGLVVCFAMIMSLLTLWRW